MSDLCLLAVSLLSQGQHTEDLIRPAVDRNGASAVTAAYSEPAPCPSASASAKAHPPVADGRSPEFSQPIFAPAKSAKSAAVPKPVAPPESAASPELAPSSQPAITPIGMPVDNSQAIAPTQTPAAIQPVTQPVTQPFTEPVAILPPPADIHTPRPYSGSQLFQQRLAALRAGRTYTRLPSNSFREAWVNATQQPTYEQWTNLLGREAAAMARGQGNNRLTVLVGDSLSLWFPSEQLASDRFWLNQGISGDTTGGVLRRLSLFANTRPDTIYVMAGINDLRQGATDDQVLNNLRQIMRQLRRAHPHAQIYIHSILPTRSLGISSHRIQLLNQSIAIIAQREGVIYSDLLAYFADSQGELRQELTTDGLHLNRQGYAVWDWVMRSNG
ncbi:MAG TPA: GDSL-type esterase/lipase family protein [Chroococcidiopsis sp.]